MHDNVTAHLFISGKVQGVFFRHNTCKRAVSLNLKGFVKNLRDGRVEVIAEGKKENIKRLIEFCKNDYLPAKIKDIEINYKKSGEKFKEFNIRY